MSSSPSGAHSGIEPGSEQFGPEQAQMGLLNGAPRTDQYSVRQGTARIAELAGELGSAGPGDQQWQLQFEFRPEASDCSGAIDPQPDHGDAARGVVPRHLLQGGHFFDARAAPGRPEVEYEPLALPLRHGLRLPVR